MDNDPNTETGEQPKPVVTHTPPSHYEDETHRPDETDPPTIDPGALPEGAEPSPVVTPPDQAEIPASNPHQPTETLNETPAERNARVAASRELPVRAVTDPETQADTPFADQTGGDIVPGAAAGPDAAGVVRNNAGGVAHAPAGSHDAAVNGVQLDGSGHVSSVGTANSSKSGTRV